MSEAERLRDEARRTSMRAEVLSLPFRPECYVAVRALSEDEVIRARAEAFESAGDQGELPWVLARATATRLVESALIDPSTIDEARPLSLFNFNELATFDDVALDELLAVYTRHVARQRGALGGS